jgi:hypothetical protein
VIERTQEIERRITSMEDELAALRANLAAVRQIALQMAGALSPVFGDAGNIAVARTVGTITARSGTTKGTGTVNFATDADALTEGSSSVTVKNIHNKIIANDAWVIIGRTPKEWLVLVIADCADLS